MSIVKSEGAKAIKVKLGIIFPKNIYYNTFVDFIRFKQDLTA